MMAKRAGQCAVNPTGKTNDAAYKKVVAENEERVNRKAAFLSLRDAAFASWEAKNGRDERVVEVTDAEGRTFRVKTRGTVCGARSSAYQPALAPRLYESALPEIHVHSSARKARKEPAK